MRFLEAKNFEKVFFRYTMGVCAFAMLVAMGAYAYLGIFSRYLADDYCEATITRSSLLNAVIERYANGAWRAADRYSNLFFSGASERLGPHSMQIIIVSMILLWALGLVWGIHEARKFAGIGWPVQFDVFLGTTFAFLTILQAPNRFQIIYWRSSMATHFAPLVFGTLFFVFWVKQARRAFTQSLSLPIYLISFVSAFLIAGFSEPPMATMITVLALMMPVVWFRMQSPVKKRILALLAWTFAGAFLALLVMAFSPAISITIQDSPPGVVKLFMDSFLFSYLFILDTVKILPLPTVVSVLIPALLVWLYKQARPSEFTQTQRRFVWIVFIASPFLMGLLIAAGFSPSVYGQGYPVERMRFLARALMTAALMLEGALIGLLLQNWQFKSNRYFGQVIGAVLFSAIAIIYPLRAVINVYGAVPEYRTRATLWDLREAYILRRINKGRTNLVIPEFPGVYGIKELDAQKDHWINKCAAAYYGVNSIRTVPVLDEDLHAILNK